MTIQRSLQNPYSVTAIEPPKAPTVTWRETHVWDLDGTPIEVPFTEIDEAEAKALGAEWNAPNETWYVPSALDPAPFEKWAYRGIDSKGYTVVRGDIRLSRNSFAFDPLAYDAFGSLATAQKEVDRLLHISMEIGMSGIVKLAKGILPGGGKVIRAFTSYPDEWLLSAIETDNNPKGSPWRETHIWDMDGTPIDVPKAEKDVAKALGAKWSAPNETWYVPSPLDPAPFEKWAPWDIDGTKTVNPLVTGRYTTMHLQLRPKGDGYIFCTNPSCGYSVSLSDAQREVTEMLAPHRKNGFGGIILLAKGRLPESGKVIRALTSYPDEWIWSAVKQKADQVTGGQDW